MSQLNGRTRTQSTSATLVESGNHEKSRRTRNNSSSSGASPAVEDDTNAYYRRSPHEIATELEVDLENGLSSAQAKERAQRYGPNELEGGGGVSWVRVLVGQIVNAMVLILIMALVVSLAIQSWIEGGVIAGVIILNIVVGFIQEYSAEKTMDSLRSLASPSAAVIRDSRNQTIASSELVPGDIVNLKTGDVVPADLRLVDAMNFETDEALLTGESLPVAKDVSVAYDGSVGIGDRLTMAFSSSTVTKGRATGIVTATGMNTEIGAIAKSLQGGDTKVRKVRRNEEGKKLFHYYVSAYALTVTDAIGRFLGVNVGTPLQRHLSQLAVGLFFLAVILAVVVMAANNFLNEREIIIYAVSTGLSMIPASLIVVLTITFAIGTKRMVERNVIVRKLDSLEALGAVTDVCSDKTGTLTQGRMVTRKAFLPGIGTWSLGEIANPYDPTDGELNFSSSAPADLSSNGELVNLDAEPSPSLQAFLDCAALCNLASVFQEHDKSLEDEKVERKTSKKVWAATGDPTEIAIQVFAHRFHHGRPTLMKSGCTELAEFPFSSDLKRMSVIYRLSEKRGSTEMAYMKGAVERILDACTTIQMADGPASINEEATANIMKNVDAMASSGLRVLALAAREWPGNVEGVEREVIERDMTLLGLVGLYDPPRPDSKGAVEECVKAGIIVRMLTGDHPGTATAIAKEIGIIPQDISKLPKYTVATASEFDALSDDEIDKLEELPRVVGRCSPQTKVRMIEALHRRKRFAAMTGDGVNDSPSLSRADVGIGMGSGSDVAKSASDIVLTDDRFSSICAAIEEGRRSFDNIKKFVLHLLAENIAQAVVLMVGLAFKDQNSLSVFPLSPVEVLWIVVVTSGPPAMGLGMEIAAPDIMDRPPHDSKRGVFTNEVLIDMVVYGFLAGGLGLGAFVLVVYGFGGGDLGLGGCNESRDGCETVFRARSTCFATICWLALILAWQMVNMRRSFFRMQPKTQTPWTQWARDVWRNQFLFWSVIGGFFVVFPLIYIPVINDRVFLHAPISWEWSIVFIAALIFIMGVELWKFCKRVYFRRQDASLQRATLA